MLCTVYNMRLFGQMVPSGLGSVVDNVLAVVGTIEYEENSYVSPLLLEPPRRNRSAEWQEEPFRGTVDPHLGYAFTTGQEIDFVFGLQSSMDQGDDRTPADVLAEMIWFEKLLLPEMDDQGLFLQPPPPVLVMLGSGSEATETYTVTQQRAWYGVFKNLSFDETGPVELQGGVPFHCKVTATLRVTKPNLAGVEPIKNWEWYEANG